MKNRTRKFLRHSSIALAMAVLVVLSGCSLINPHISMPPPATVAVPVNLPAGEKQVQQITFYGDLPLYIDYANEMRDKYYAGVGHQSLLRNGTALTLIPLAAAALYLGIIGEAGTNTMAALGVTGAAAYGMSSYLESRPRQSVYLAGADAIGCSVLSVTPWLVMQDDFDSLNYALVGYSNRVVRSNPNIVDVSFNNRKSLTVAISNALAKAARLEALSNAFSSMDIIDVRINVAQSRVTEARTRISRADESRQKGLILRSEIVTAHLRLYNQLMNIRDQVSKQVIRTEPQLDEILGYIGSLASSSSIFAPTPLQPGAPAGEVGVTESAEDNGPRSLRADETAELIAAESELDTELALLAESVAAIENLVSQVDAAKANVTTLASCIPEDLVLPMEILPRHPITFFADTSGTTAVFVKHGKKPFVPRILGPTASAESGITVESPRDLGPDLIIKANAPQRGDYTLLVTDADGTTATKAISVTGGPLKIAPPKTEPPRCPDVDGLVIASSIGNDEECVPRADGRTIQKALCLRDEDGNSAADGIFGEQTRLAICQWRKDHQEGGQCSNPTASGLSTGEINKLKSGGECSAGARSWFENHLSSTQLLGVINTVGADAGGVNSASDSGALAKLRAQLKEPETRMLIARFSESKKLAEVLEKNPKTGATSTREVISREMLGKTTPTRTITSAEKEHSKEALCLAKTVADDSQELKDAVKQLHADFGIGTEGGELDAQVVTFLSTEGKCDGAKFKSFFESNSSFKAHIEGVLAVAGVDPDSIDQLPKAETRTKIKALNKKKHTDDPKIDADSELITCRLVNLVALRVSGDKSCL